MAILIQRDTHDEAGPVHVSAVMKGRSRMPRCEAMRRKCLQTWRMFLGNEGSIKGWGRHARDGKDRK